MLNTLFCYFRYFYFWNINMSFVKKFIKKLIFFNFKSNFLKKVFYCVTKIYDLATIHSKMPVLQHFLNFLRNSTLFAIHKKWSFPLRISSVDVINTQETADLVTFTEEIFNGRLHFLCSGAYYFQLEKIWPTSFF